MYLAFHEFIAKPIGFSDNYSMVCTVFFLMPFAHVLSCANFGQTSVVYRPLVSGGPPTVSAILYVCGPQ